MLQYPMRFELVAKAAGAPLHEGVAASNDGALMLFALYQQATVGNCNMEQPSMWALTEYAKYTCWNAIRDMDRMQAMHKYVKTVEEERPEIWEDVEKIMNTEGNSGDQCSEASTVRVGNGDELTKSDQTPRGDVNKDACSKDSKCEPRDQEKTTCTQKNEECDHQNTDSRSPIEDRKIGSVSKDVNGNKMRDTIGTHSRYAGTSREVGALLSALQVVEKNPCMMEDHPPSAQEVLRVMLRTKAILDQADSELKKGLLEEASLKEHLDVLNPENVQVEPDSGSFSLSSLRASKQRSEILVSRGQVLLEQIETYIATWRNAINEELKASEEGDGGDMLGDRGSFGFQALACLLPLKQRATDIVSRWIKIDIKFGAIASAPLESDPNNSGCTLS